MMGVSAMGRKLFRAVTVECLGTGTMEAVLNLLGTTVWASDRLKMFINTPANCSAQAQSTHLATPSGPATFVHSLCSE